jgi:heme exporter protein C
MNLNGSMLTRLLGGTAIIALMILTFLALKVTPPDVVQDDYVRLIYIHPALATMMYAAFALTAAASALYLFPRTRSRFWDLLAGAAAEVGVVFTGLVLITGSIWGRPTWGVWWTWDARLTSTALLFVLFLGYLALRRVPSDTSTAAKRSAIAALVAMVDVPIVHFSVEWWRTLHQKATLQPGDVTIHGSQLFTMLLSFPTMGLVLAWLVIQRFRMERALDDYESVALDLALEERRAEGEARRIVGASS